MPKDTRPLYLFADSQLLFWKSGGKRLLEGLAAGGAESQFRRRFLSGHIGSSLRQKLTVSFSSLLAVAYLAYYLLVNTDTGLI